MASVTARIAFAQDLSQTMDDGVAYLTPPVKRVDGTSPPVDLLGLYGAFTDVFAEDGPYAT
jgi:hypothetical protein